MEETYFVNSSQRCILWLSQKGLKYGRGLGHYKGGRRMEPEIY